MVIETKLLQDSAKKIFDAVDSHSSTPGSETLEMEMVGNVLHLNVANNEYFVSVKIPLEFETEFHVVVKATLFLDLISKITTKEVSFEQEDTYLLIKANGKYKIPYIVDKDGALVTINKIHIDNVTSEFAIDTTILKSILKYNSKELAKSGSSSKDARRFFHVDEQGAITFAAGACVNSFTLPQPVVLTLSEKLVKLFKLFNSDSVDFKIGYDEVAGAVQTKVSFEDDYIQLVAILTSDKAFTTMVPKEAIRNLANSVYKYEVVVDKNILLDAINRLAIFVDLKSKTLSPIFHIDFGSDELVVYDTKKENLEPVPYSNAASAISYSVLLNANDLKLTLESCDEDFITIRFGNNKAIIIERNNVKNILPEVRETR